MLDNQTPGRWQGCSMHIHVQWGIKQGIKGHPNNFTALFHSKDRTWEHVAFESAI